MQFIDDMNGIVNLGDYYVPVIQTVHGHIFHSLWQFGLSSMAVVNEDKVIQSCDDSRHVMEYSVSKNDKPKCEMKSISFQYTGFVRLKNGTPVFPVPQHKNTAEIALGIWRAGLCREAANDHLGYQECGEMQIIY